MAYDKQGRLRDELNARFPRIRSNLGRQMFRSAYYNGRQHGESVEEAISTSITAVRVYVPDFTPIEAWRREPPSRAWGTA